MRLTIQFMGHELDVTLGPIEAEAAEFETYQDAGTTGSTVVGFGPSPAPEWMTTGLPGYDEPSEGDEDT